MQWDKIESRARAVLSVTTEFDGEDIFLWEHSMRVAHNARCIAGFPEVCDVPPDLVAVTAAALYHEVGWIERLRSREIRRVELLIRPRIASQSEEAAMMLERSLSDLLPQESLTRALEAVRSLYDRDAESVEARIVSEADNLDQFGLLSLWLVIRRGIVDGKGVQNVIDTWKSRKDFGYWKALLDDSFQLPSVRAVAEERLDQLEHLMEGLELQHLGEDLAQFSRTR